MFPEDLKTTQDYDLFIRMCHTRPFVHQAETLVRGRLHEKQGSTTLQCHQMEVNSWYQRYLPDLVEASTKNKTCAEAARQRIWLAGQLYHKGLIAQAKAIAGFVES
ncbi:MAG: hypothetical protein LBK44_06635, partial [Spirochaetales bacterium]|nr:hypothetical protein [Spirochaetales bacterium]